MRRENKRSLLFREKEAKSFCVSLALALQRRATSHVGAAENGGRAREKAKAFWSFFSKKDCFSYTLHATTTLPLRKRIGAWRQTHSMPAPTGQPADKAFFDDLSGQP